MKICYITNLYPPHVLGGAEIVVKKIATQMAKKHTVIIITTSPDNNPHIIKQDSIIIYQLNTTKLYPVYKQTEASGCLLYTSLLHTHGIYLKMIILNLLKETYVMIKF